MKNRIRPNVAAINRSLHHLGESVGHGNLVDRQMPAYHDGKDVHLYMKDVRVVTPPHNQKTGVAFLPHTINDRVCDETAAFNRSLALHGEAL